MLLVSNSTNSIKTTIETYKVALTQITHPQHSRGLRSNSKIQSLSQHRFPNRLAEMTRNEVAPLQTTDETKRAGKRGDASGATFYSLFYLLIL